MLRKLFHGIEVVGHVGGGETWVEGLSSGALLLLLPLFPQVVRIKKLRWVSCRGSFAEVEPRHRVERQFNPVRHSKLVENAKQIVLNGVLAQV